MVTESDRQTDRQINVVTESDRQTDKCGDRVRQTDRQRDRDCFSAVKAMSDGEENWEVEGGKEQGGGGVQVEGDRGGKGEGDR